MSKELKEAAEGLAVFRAELNEVAQEQNRLQDRASALHRRMEPLEQKLRNSVGANIRRRAFAIGDDRVLFIEYHSPNDVRMNIEALL